MWLCRVICRARLIPFIHPLEYNLLSTSTINKAYELAPAAGPLLVNIGCRLSNIEAQDLKNIQAHIKDVLPNLDSRAVMEYTILMASALQVNKTSHMHLQGDVPDCIGHAFIHRILIIYYAFM